MKQKYIKYKDCNRTSINMLEMTRIAKSLFEYISNIESEDSRLRRENEMLREQIAKLEKKLKNIESWPNIQSCWSPTQAHRWVGEWVV